MGCSLNTCYQWRMKRSKITSEVESKEREIFSKFQIHKLIVLDFVFRNNRDKTCFESALRTVHFLNDSLLLTRFIVHWRLNLNFTYKLVLKYIYLLLCCSRVVQHYIFFWFHNLWRIKFSFPHQYSLIPNAFIELVTASVNCQCDNIIKRSKVADVTAVFCVSGRKFWNFNCPVSIFHTKKYMPAFWEYQKSSEFHEITYVHKSELEFSDLLKLSQNSLSEYIRSQTSHKKRNINVLSVVRGNIFIHFSNNFI